jgi:hypothetical protein
MLLSTLQDGSRRPWYRPWLFLVFLLAVTWGVPQLAQLCQQSAQQPDGPIAGAAALVTEDTTPGTIAAIGAAPRAVVFLYVTWSMDAEHGHRAFLEAAPLLPAERRLPEVVLFIVKEDAPVAQDWLTALKQEGQLKQLTVGYGHWVGAGSVLWLERGRVIAEAWFARQLGGPGIVERTRKLWPQRD